MYLIETEKANDSDETSWGITVTPADRLLKKKPLDFPGDPAVKTPCFQCRV